MSWIKIRKAAARMTDLKVSNNEYEKRSAIIVEKGHAKNCYWSGEHEPMYLTKGCSDDCGKATEAGHNE